MKGMIKGSYEHDVTLGQIHVDEFHNTKSEFHNTKSCTAPIPTFIFDYKNKQFRILTDHLDNEI